MLQWTDRGPWLLRLLLRWVATNGLLRYRLVFVLVLGVALLSLLAPLLRGWEGGEVWVHLRNEDEWPELDPPSSLPRRCSAKHAALEIAGVDPGLLRINLPPWQPKPDSNRTGIAYLAPCGLPHRLGIVARVFQQLYRPRDFFYYQVDRDRPGLRAALVERLGEPTNGLLPSNVVVANMPHAGRVYYWGHTANVFTAMHEMLRLSKDWQWVIHLHDGAYPVHAPEYMRQYLSERRGVNFMEVDPWDAKHWQASRLTMVHSCEAWVGRVSGQTFPQAEVTSNGFRWAQGGEWWAITRELATYFVDDRLRPFLNLMQYRINVEEIIWASMVLNIPGFAQLVANKLTWETFWCKKENCRDTRHSPTNLEDTLLDLYYPEFRSKLQDLFFVRTITPQRSEHLLAWLDARILWERNFFESPNFTVFPPSGFSYPRSPSSGLRRKRIRQPSPHPKGAPRRAEGGGE
mmetsp:Transcript_6208/g.15232  ORF Transcript_6208/g.15232 Transcript_6208/m.15232 type:complete len:460 (-) Transcript_6208:26-1405(-)